MLTSVVKMIRVDPIIVSEKEQEYSFNAYVQMEELLDKLKLLKYESEFLNDLKIKPIHKYYFIIPKNSGEQFYLFSILAAWLIRNTGKSFTDPQEYDDPNETITRILDEVKQNGIKIEISPNKLKQGVGYHAIAVLDFLANCAIKKKNIFLQKPKPPEENEKENEVQENDSEILLDRVEEEMIAAYSDDSDEEAMFRLDDLKTVNKEVVPLTDLNSKINDESWQLEVERVLPQLRVTINNENRDWRSHLEQMKTYKSYIDESINGSRNQLEKMHKDIYITLEKIGNREKYLNRELVDILDEYRMLKDQLSTLKENYGNVSTGVASRNRELNKLTEKLEKVKHQMEERGSSMTDGTPLVNIKKNINKVKADIADMDIRIGVLNCVLMQTKLRDEKLIEDEYMQAITIF